MSMLGAGGCRDFQPTVRLRSAAMNHRPGALAALLAAASALLFSQIGAAADAPAPLDPALAAAMAHIRDGAMASDWSWQRLEELTDRIGPRLSGSPQHAAAIAQVAAA